MMQKTLMIIGILLILNINIVTCTHYELVHEATFEDGWDGWTNGCCVYYQTEDRCLNSHQIICNDGYNSDHSAELRGIARTETYIYKNIDNIAYLTFDYKYINICGSGLMFSINDYFGGCTPTPSGCSPQAIGVGASANTWYNKRINFSECYGTQQMTFTNRIANAGAACGLYDTIVRIDNIKCYQLVPTYITLNFRDNCGNLMRNIEYAIAREGYADYPLGWHTSASGSVDIVHGNYDYLEIYTNSDVGKLYYNISNPQDITYSVNNPYIQWFNYIWLYNGSSSESIVDATVTFSQDCIIDKSLYPVRNKFTNIYGCAVFNQCELDDFTINILATGYLPFSDTFSSANMDAFDILQSIDINLYRDTTGEYNYTDWETSIYFKDIAGNQTMAIYDTDDYVDLYYYNNNSEGVAMTLAFQKCPIGDYTFSDLLSWNIPYNDFGYKRILKTNYTDHLDYYRGILYNPAVEGWDRIKYLNIKNETVYEPTYENLSTILWFRGKNPEGSIDYRQDIQIVAYANSSYAPLLTISLELYDNGAYVDHINLTWADFSSADLKWYYKWNPSHTYVNGHNYTVRMHGFDYHLLESDHINAENYRKNKLTIIVKDRSGTNLNNAFVFLEGYGSLSTGVSYYNSYEGLNNGDYRYKASKFGYSAAGWDNINLTDGDEIVAYVLTSDTGNTTYTPIKTSDADIQSFFFPMMFILFIFMLMGAFRYVCS